MKLSKPITLLTSLTLTATASAAFEDAIPATSRLGRSLLKNARSLQNGEAEGTWQAGYSIKFHSCATNDSFYGDYFGNNQANNNNNADAQFNGVYKQRLAHFQLCPSDTCGSSNSGCNDYVTDLSDFLYSYIQNKIAMETTACESVKETCNCENANDDERCLSNCYTQAGLSYCEQQDGGGDANGQISLQDAVYCTQLEVDEQAMEYYRYDQNLNNQNNYANNYNNNYNAQAQQQAQQGEVAFFVGPHCHNGKIILGLFTDETCSTKAADGTYEKMFFGQQLPHSSTSIIESKCMSCKVPRENDGNVNQNNVESQYYYENGQMYQQQQQQEYQEQEPDEVTEACGQLYEQSAKCEESLRVNGVYPDTRACNYIRNLKKEGGSVLSTLSQKANVTPSVLAGVFAATTVMFAGLSVYLNQKVKRSKVQLVHGGRSMA